MFRTAFAVVLTLAAAVEVTRSEPLYGGAPKDIKDYLKELVRVYPNNIVGYDDDFLILKNGLKFRISDGRNDKTFEELVEKPDIDDMFYVRYPAGKMPKQPGKNIDPGRVRFEPLFVSMYGDCSKNEVRHNLRRVKWLPNHSGGSVEMTIVNGAADALEDVSRELDKLPDDLMQYVKSPAGGYNCRKIAGSNAKSMHAYGAAVDINTKYANYWRWGRGEPQWQNRIPIEIVRIFERHGFIWGGYWFHYDTMHFEFRPELLRPR